MLERLYQSSILPSQHILEEASCVTQGVSFCGYVEYNGKKMYVGGYYAR